MGRLNVFVVAALLTTQLCFSSPNEGSSSDVLSDGLPKAGMEWELALKDKLIPHPNNIPERFYSHPLKVIRDLLKDYRNEPFTTENFGKWTGMDAKVWIYTTPERDEYRTTPERIMIPYNYHGMNGQWSPGSSKEVNEIGGFDGIEVVTPPLRKGQDFDLAQTMLSTLFQGEEYAIGKQSSMHVTVDVSALIDPKTGNASRLRDTILFIENHTPEIYLAISPKRYGTLVNYYSVPLGAQQRELLIELASLSEEQCTQRNLKNIFLKYQDKELHLVENTNEAWKYRSANYKKVMSLIGVPPLDVIEFRLADLDPERVASTAKFFRTIVDRAWKLDPHPKFLDPFHGTRVTRGNYEELNERIAQFDSGSYKKFLNDLSLTEKEYPKLGRLQNPEQFVRDAFVGGSG